MNFALNLWQSWTDFLCNGHEWELFITLTFAESIHPEAADKRLNEFFHDLNKFYYGKRYDRFPNKPSIIWVAGVERQKRGVIHFHCLAKNVPGYFRYEDILRIWREGHPNNGYMLTEKIRVQSDVTHYVTKYVVKEGEIVLCPQFRTAPQIELGLFEDGHAHIALH